jgi:Domain of unknown function (DUF5615)
VKVLLDEMYPVELAKALLDWGIDAVTVAEQGLSGRPDSDVFAAAIASGRAVLTENVSDFSRISGDHLGAGEHHDGVLIALSSRFSRRPSGYGAIVAAVAAVAADSLGDRLIYLEHHSPR